MQPGLETKKPAAGGGAAGFSKEPNNDWEEECRCSNRRPWEEEWAGLKFEALREEVHRFDEKQNSRSHRILNRLCCSAAMRTVQWFNRHRKLNG